MPISGAMMLGGAAMVLASAARQGGPDIALRIGGWASTYGILMGLGAMSLWRLIPAAWSAIRTGQSNGLHRIAFGFSAYWIEGCAAFVFAAAGYSLLRKPAAASRWLGFAVILGAAALAGWRLSHV